MHTSYPHRTVSMNPMPCAMCHVAMCDQDFATVPGPRAPVLPVKGIPLPYWQEGMLGCRLIGPPDAWVVTELDEFEFRMSLWLSQHMSAYTHLRLLEYEHTFETCSMHYAYVNCYDSEYYQICTYSTTLRPESRIIVCYLLLCPVAPQLTLFERWRGAPVRNLIFILA